MGRGVCWPHVNLSAFTVTGMEAVVPPVPTIIIIWNLYIYCKYSATLHLHMSLFLHWHPPATWGQASSSPRGNPVTSPCSDTGSGDIRSGCPGASGKSAYCGVPSGTVGRPAGLMPSCGHPHLFLFWSDLRASLPEVHLHRKPWHTHHMSNLWVLHIPTCATCGAHVLPVWPLFLSCNSTIKSLVTPVQDKPQ